MRVGQQFKRSMVLGLAVLASCSSPTGEPGFSYGFLASKTGSRNNGNHFIFSIARRASHIPQGLVKLDFRQTSNCNRRLARV